MSGQKLNDRTGKEIRKIGKRSREKNREFHEMIARKIMRNLKWIMGDGGRDHKITLNDH